MNELRTTALGIGLLTFGTPAMAVPPTPSPSPNPSRPGFVARPEQPFSDGESLYSRRALREMRAYLRLRMLELREADLDRARSVIERRLGTDALLGPAATPAPLPR